MDQYSERQQAKQVIAKFYALQISFDDSAMTSIWSLIWPTHTGASLSKTLINSAEVKQSKALAVVSFVCALYLGLTLTLLGLDKFHYILAGGKKFATFPDWQTQVGIGLSYLILNLLYLIWFFAAAKPQASAQFSSLLKRCAVFLAIAFVAYPLGDDIYLYLHSGLMNLSDVNPFLVRAKAFTTAMSPFVDWGQTSTYGPLSQLLFTAAAAIIPAHPVWAIYGFKSLCLGLHILNGYLIWRLLSFPERDTIALAYLLNPLLLMEQVGSGHVDVLLSTSAIVAVGSLTTRRYLSASVALWGGFLAKTLPIIWMPLVGIFLFRQKRWRSLIGATALSIALIAALWVSFLPGMRAWQSLLNPGVAGQYQSSLHALANSWLHLFHLFLPTAITLAQINHVLLKFSHYTIIAFLGFYLWLALRGYTRSHYTELNLVEDIGWATLTLLLYATPWLMPWYASILLTIAALIPQAQRFGMTSLAFGVSSSAQYLLQGHNSLKSLVAVGVPTLVLIVGSQFLQSRQPSASTQTPVQS